MSQPDYRRANDVTPTERRSVYRQTAVGADDADVTREIYEERVAGMGDDQVVRAEHVRVPSDGARRAATIARIKQIIYYVFGIVSVLLLLRFIFLALGASQASPFVNFIYALSRPFALPFQGMFSEPTIGDSVLEWASLVGIAIYLLVAYGLARLVELIYAPPRVGE